MIRLQCQITSGTPLLGHPSETSWTWCRVRSLVRNSYETQLPKYYETQLPKYYETHLPKYYETVSYLMFDISPSVKLIVSHLSFILEH